MYLLPITQRYLTEKTVKMPSHRLWFLSQEREKWAGKTWDATEKRLKEKEAHQEKERFSSSCPSFKSMFMYHESAWCSCIFPSSSLPHSLSHACKLLSQPQDHHHHHHDQKWKCNQSPSSSSLGWEIQWDDHPRSHPDWLLDWCRGCLLPTLSFFFPSQSHLSLAFEARFTRRWRKRLINKRILWLLLSWLQNKADSKTGRGGQE